MKKIVTIKASEIRRKFKHVERYMGIDGLYRCPTLKWIKEAADEYDKLLWEKGTPKAQVGAWDCDNTADLMRAVCCHKHAMEGMRWQCGIAVGIMAYDVGGNQKHMSNFAIIHNEKKDKRQLLMFDPPYDPFKLAKWQWESMFFVYV